MSGYDVSGVLDDARRVGQNALLKLGKQIAEVRSIGVKSVQFYVRLTGGRPWTMDGTAIVS